MSDCVFCAIAAGRIASRMVHEDEQLIAFHDVQPQAPLHLLIVPRRHIASLDAAEASDRDLLGQILLTAQDLAAAHGVAGGYRLVNNCGATAGQSVPHLHFHLLAGRRLAWPPG